jgi:hypothetical protein
MAPRCSQDREGGRWAHAGAFPERAERQGAPSTTGSGTPCGRRRPAVVGGSGWVGDARLTAAGGWGGGVGVWQRATRSSGASRSRSGTRWRCGRGILWWTTAPSAATTSWTCASSARPIRRAKPARSAPWRGVRFLPVLALTHHTAVALWPVQTPQPLRSPLHAPPLAEQSHRLPR